MYTVWERRNCQCIPPPPPACHLTLPSPDPGSSTESKDVKWGVLDTQSVSACIQTTMPYLYWCEAKQHYRQNFANAKKIDIGHIGVCILVAILGLCGSFAAEILSAKLSEAQLFGRLTFLSTCCLLVCDLISFLV